MNLIGSRVLTRRRSLRMTRETMIARMAAVAHGECNIGTADLARIEHEQRTVITTELLVIAEVLGTTPHELLGGTSWKKATSVAEPGPSSGDNNLP